MKRKPKKGAKRMSQELKKYFSTLGKRGGKARMAALTPEARKRLARRAVNTRWRNWRKKRGEQA